MKLKGKVAIVTGSSRGIGKATALLFAREGANVVINYKSDKKNALKEDTPLKRIADPDEIARAILFLSSDDASYITGEMLVVDGGYSLK